MERVVLKCVLGSFSWYVLEGKYSLLPHDLYRTKRKFAYRKWLAYEYFFFQIFLLEKNCLFTPIFVFSNRGPKIEPRTLLGGCFPSDLFPQKIQLKNFLTVGKQARKVQLKPNPRTRMGFTSPGGQVAHSTSSVHFVEQVKHFTYLILTVIFKSTKTMIQLASKAG